MTDEPRIQQLLEELLASHATPEAVCSSCPELLPVVRKRWRRIRRLDADLDVLFPPPDETPHPPEWTDLPQVPGYELEEVLGRGGMGIVFRARHLRLNRLVALKMILAGAFADPCERARFQREAEAAAALRNANIVQVYDVGESNGRPYFTMEYIEGGSLAAKLGGTPQTPQQAAQLLATLAAAVQAAHERGVVHRDLKPANVLLTADGIPKISDFGLARRLEGETTITRTGVAVGTPSYMAPEQALGRPDALRPAVDVYALGAILYELLTGRPPFRAASAAFTFQQVVSQEPAPPSRLNDKVPRDLETICLKCLHKEPGRRYASAAALADDLRRFGEGRSIQARPVGQVERLWRWVRRNPTGAALLVTALASVGLVSGGGMWLVQQRAWHDAEMRNDVVTAVAQAEGLRKGFHFREARELLGQARQRLGPAGPDNLRRQVELGLADLDLVEQLDAARFQEAIVRGKFNPTRPDPLYASAFAQAGLGQPGDDIAVVAARVQHSSVRAEIIDALDDWASVTRDPVRQKWLFEIARRVDPDPERDRVRQPDLWEAPDWATRPIPELQPDKISPRMATALARLMQTRGVEAITPLAAVQARVPEDFWLNFELSNALFRVHRQNEALGYARAALALRPQSCVARTEVGVIAQEMGHLDEAIDQHRKALEIDPNYSEARYNLGEALRSQGKLDEATVHLRKAIAINPKLTNAYIALGVVLQSKNQLDEAVNLFKEAIRIDPRNAVAHNDLAIVLGLQDRLDEAIDQLQEAVNLDPKYAIGHINLGAALWVKGRLEEAIEHIQQAARLDSRATHTQIFLCYHLYAAACAAVRETTGHRVGKPRPDETARANLRLRALDWLRASLNLGIKLVNNGQGKASWLIVWQTDSTLASVRDPAELAKLPAAEREPWQRLWVDVAAVVAADPMEQGRAHAARRDWAQAADYYARVLTRGPTDGHFWFEYAALLLLSGDRPGYVQACAHLMDRCGKDKGLRSYHVARACTLAPRAVADMSLPGRLGEMELSSREFWSLTERGALAYRAGRFQEAVPLFKQSLRANSKPGAAVLNWLWLALAHQRLGNADEARPWLGKAQAWLDQYKDGMPARAEEKLGLHLHNWLEAHVLRREAEALIRPAEKR